MPRNTLRSSALLLFGLTVLPGNAVSEGKSLQEQLVGTWKIISVNNTRPDGSVKQIFGPNPMGIAVFDARGNTVVVLMRAGRLKFAADNRDLGTADEYKATVQGTHAYFGTYSVIEQKRPSSFTSKATLFPTKRVSTPSD
jgi:hypothetical protein